MKLKLLFIALVVFCSLLLAQTSSTEAIEEFETSGGIFAGIGSWVAQWQLLSLVLIFISIIFVAAAYMFATALNIYPLRIWADVELGQVIASGVILVMMISTLAFLDEFVGIVVVELTDIGGDSLLTDYSSDMNMSKMMFISTNYLEDLKDISMKSAERIGKNNIEYTREAYKREGVSTTFFGLFYFATSYAPNAGMSILSEGNNALMQYLGDIIASLEAQIFFMDVIIFPVGPLLIILGVLARSFFLTRKLGGLLLAIAIGLMIVYPLTYSLSLLTFGVQVYGVDIIKHAGDCPPECLLKPPVAYNLTNTSQTFDSYAGIMGMLPDGITIGEANETDWNSVEIGTCDYACGNCTGNCRILPNLPSECACPDVDCSNCPDQCKIVRYREDCVSICPQSQCPDLCKANYTELIENNCSGCDDCPNYCRYKYDNGTNIYQPGCIASACDDCDCKIILPSSAIDCDLECAGCPDYCRIGDGNFDGCDIAACDSCPQVCYSDPPSGDCDDGNYSDAKINNCQACIDACRMNFDDVPAGIVALYGGNVEDMVPPICKEYPFSEFCDETNCPSSCDIEAPKFCLEYGELGNTITNIGCNSIPEECRYLIGGKRPAFSVCQGTMWNECECIEELVLPEGCGDFDGDRYTRYVNGDPGDYDNCTVCPPECRINDGDGMLNPWCSGCGEVLCLDSCKITLPGPTICGLPDGTSTDYGGCHHCPVPCRLNDGRIECDYNFDSNDNYCDDVHCAPECKVNITYGGTCQEFNRNQLCLGCPMECRILSGSTAPICSEPAIAAVCLATTHSHFTCFDSCKVRIISDNPCNGCMDCHPDCVNVPAVRTDCGTICGSLSGYVDLSGAAIFYGLGGTTDHGQFGEPSQILVDARNIGVLLIPAYAIPLLNIIITLSFIAVFSKSLGGDYDIPGISKFI